MQKSLLIWFSIFLTFFLCTPGSAQTTTGFITGKITEQTTGQPLPGAKVSIKMASGAKDAVADDAGAFVLELPSGVYDVDIAKSGFASLTKNRVEVVGKRYTVMNVQLGITVSANVEVRSEIFAENAEQPVSNVTLSRQDIQATPGTGGDPLRAINSQPAVTASSGEFADLIVRGGTAEENLTFIDNVPVKDFTYFTDQYDGNHGGRLAILAPDVIDRAEFSAGGSGARYGDKMSSTLDIGIREANRKKVQGVFFIDSGSAGGSVDVPIGKKGSWLSSARRSYIDVALDVAGIAQQGLIGYPRTFDFTNKFVYDVTPRQKLTFTVMNFFESFNQTDDQASRMDRRTDRLRMNRTSQRHIFGTTLSSVIGTKTLAQTTAWFNVNHNDGSFFLPFSTVLQRFRNLHDSQAGIKEDLSAAVAPKVRVAAGGSLYLDQANYYSLEHAGGFFSPLEEEFRAPTRENRLRLNSTASANAYLQAQLFLTSRFSITPGIRLDRYGVTNETFLSPRLAARFNASGRIALTFATGIYRQPPSLFILSLTANNRSLKSQRSTHIIGGVDWLASENIRVRFEAYRKTYDNLVVQQIGPTPAFVSNGDYFNSGKGHAEGFEISVQKALTGIFSGQASYGFIRSRRTLAPGGIEIPSDFERPHQFTVIGITRFYGFSVAAKYRVASGLPYTSRLGLVPFTGAGFFIQRIRSAADINAPRQCRVHAG